MKNATMNQSNDFFSKLISLDNMITKQIMEFFDRIAWVLLKNLAKIILRVKRISKKKYYRVLWLRRIGILAVSIVLALTFSIFMAEKANAEESTDDVFYKYYQAVEIEEGDSLWEYAREYRHQETYASYIQEVMQINHMSNDHLVSGETIILPYYSNEYIVK